MARLFKWNMAHIGPFSSNSIPMPIIGYTFKDLELQNLYLLGNVTYLKDYVYQRITFGHHFHPQWKIAHNGTHQN